MKYKIIKRFFDILFAFLGIIVLSPLLFTVSLMILYFDIKSGGDGSFLKGLKEMTSDVVFWYILLALIIFLLIPILFAKKLGKNKQKKN